MLAVSEKPPRQSPTTSYQHPQHPNDLRKPEVHFVVESSSKLVKPSKQSIIESNTNCKELDEVPSGSKYELTPQRVEEIGSIENCPTRLPNQTTHSTPSKKATSPYPRPSERLQGSVNHKKHVEDDDISDDYDSELSDDEDDVAKEEVAHLWESAYPGLAVEIKAQLLTVLANLPQDVLERHFNTCGSGSSENSHGRGSTSDAPPAKRQALASGRNIRRTRSRLPRDDQGDEGPNETPPQNPDDHEDHIPEQQRRFACPYFKRCRAKHMVNRPCAGPGWVDVHRVK
jgi:hypothetical protein